MYIAKKAMEPTPISLAWMDILKVALSTGVAAALLNQSISWFKDWTSERKNISREGRYLALRIAVILERFSIDCAELIASYNLHDQSDGHAGKQSGSLPILPAYPSDADWKSLNPALCAKALAMRNELELSDKALDFHFEVDAFQLGSAFKDEAGKCGYRAWEIATELRSLYKLPSFRSKDLYWDFVETLKDNHDAAMRRLADSQNSD